MIDVVSSMRARILRLKAQGMAGGHAAPHSGVGCGSLNMLGCFGSSIVRTPATAKSLVINRREPIHPRSGMISPTTVLSLSALAWWHNP